MAQTATVVTAVQTSPALDMVVRCLAIAEEYRCMAFFVGTQKQCQVLLGHN